ncbi:MAG: hypothetical protein JWM86_1012, partial [Thermoleophilia bacterium]|nr:hypothetical protein [Thermoleophilia bacterium]
VLPFALHRFASTFRAAPRWLEALAWALTAAAVVGSLAAGDPPPEGADPTPAFQLLALVFAVQWGVLLSAVSIRLWWGGRRQPPVARRRMRLLSAGSLGMAIALGISAGSSSAPEDSGIAVLIALLVIGSALAFFCGYLPPRMMRATWRAESQVEVRRAMIALMATDEEQDLSVTFLPHVAALVGGRAAAMVGREGELLGSWGLAAEEFDPAAPDRADMLRVPAPFGEIIVWTTPYTPFFGTDELSTIQSLGVVIELALERYHAIAQQREIAERLVAVNELKNEFVAVVAHDLRSPMSVISGFARTLDQQWDNVADDRKREILRMIAENTETLSVLVEDVLQVARIESGELSYDMKPFKLDALVARIARDLGSLGEHPIDLHVDARLPEALGDEDRQWQVLTNLVTNAMKFSDPSAPVSISVWPRDERIVVSVRDRGIGIRAEDQARVFDKFSRIDPVDRTKRVKGTGLGLFICRSIVEAHGGTLALDSTPGEGSTFSYSLPIAPPQEHTA